MYSTLKTLPAAALVAGGGVLGGPCCITAASLMPMACGLLFASDQWQTLR